MSVRKDEVLQTIDELSKYANSIPKACTLGVVIDATNAYFDENKARFVKKVKLVDDTYNTAKYNPHQKYSYLTVFFYGPKIEDLPNPQRIGDLIYLRRFSFGKYNDSFQGHYIEAQYCSWALLNLDPHTDLEEYQSSRVDLNLGEEEKYPNLNARARDLRDFSREYLSNTSVITILPTGINPKDKDVIVQVIKKNEDGYRLNNGHREIVLANTVSFAEEGQIAKLRSIVREDNGVVVPNNFTSLIVLPDWTHDAQLFRKRASSSMDIETEGEIFTSLAELHNMPLSTSSLIQKSARTSDTM